MNLISFILSVSVEAYKKIEEFMRIALSEELGEISGFL